MPAPSKYAFPQKSAPIDTSTGERGVASLFHPDVGSPLRFRTNPNEFSWTYTLNRRVDTTYGGRVVQLLGTKIDDFTFKADCGGGRWAYMNKVAKFMRDVMVAQRNGTPATFEYTTRGWKLNCFIAAVPFQDSVEEVVREFEIQCKVQEDVSGVASKNFLSAEIRRLQDGINFKRGPYNDPNKGQSATDSEKGIFDIANIVQQGISTFAGLGAFADVQNFLPNGVAGEPGSQNGFDIGNLINGSGG